MNRLFCVSLLSLILTGCVEVQLGDTTPATPTPVVTPAEYPVVNLPRSLRQQNWLGSLNEGSCVHASMIMLFRWQGENEMADFWRRNHGNGEYATRLASKLDKAGVRFAYTTDGDVDFLDQACQTRRGCGVVVMGGRHMVCLVHLDEHRAGLLDNNDINRIIWVPRSQFIKEWKYSGGWAVTPVYSPAPPLAPM